MGTKLFLKNSSNQFLKNSSGNFIYRALPPEYQEVEYIGAGSGQYIATNLNFNHTTSLEISSKSYTTSTGERACIASEYSGGSNLSLEIISSLRVYNSGNPDFANSGYVNNSVNEYVIRFNRTAQTIESECKGTIVSRSNALYGNNGVNFYLFVDRSLRFSTFNKTHRLYYFKIIKDGKDYCYLVPCIRILDGKPGLYDLVNSIFYTNAGTGEFTFGPCLDLPNTYQWVEYIQSSGTQYINTGYIPTIDLTRSFAIFMPLSTADTAFFGARNGSNPYYFFYNMGSNYTWPISQAIKVTGSAALAINSKYAVDWNKNDYKFCDQNLELLEYATRSGSAACSTSMYIFNFQPTDSRSTTAKLYTFKIYHNDQLVREFVPCYRKSDSVIGLYDLVNQQFYTNAGTGAFMKGPDIG